jgi:hypothetical protein
MRYCINYSDIPGSLCISYTPVSLGCFMGVKLHDTSADLMTWRDHYKEKEGNDFIQWKRSFISIMHSRYNYKFCSLANNAMKPLPSIILRCWCKVRGSHIVLRATIQWPASSAMSLIIELSRTYSFTHTTIWRGEHRSGSSPTSNQLVPLLLRHHFRCQIKGGRTVIWRPV